MLPEDYTYYLLFAEKDYYPLTVVEYVYSKMAEKAGIIMMTCELIEIGSDRHFLTEKYDRKNGKKIHIQSLAAMNPDANSYEDLMLVCEDLNLPFGGGRDWLITPAYDLTFPFLIRVTDLPHPLSESRW